jgi:hypothetical protein
MMTLPENQSSSSLDGEVWAQRRRNNVRLGWFFGAVAIALFFVALWKYRPL